MSLHHSPRIITDGLVLCLDAGNPRSYSGSGSTWLDLVNGRIATLIASPVYTSRTGSFKFDWRAPARYATVNGTFTLTQATFIAWFRPSPSASTNFAGFIYSRNTGGTSGLNYEQSGRIGYSWNNASNTWGFQGGPTIPNNQWSMIAVSVLPNSATLYVYSSSQMNFAINNVSHSSTTLNNLRVGNDSNSDNRTLDGELSIAQMYDKALTQNELLQNYNALKGRFNL